MNPIEFNPDNLSLAGDDKKIVQRLDFILSRIELKENEYLLIKLGKHMIPIIKDIRYIVSQVFKEHGDKVLVYVDGDISFEKVTFNK